MTPYPDPPGFAEWETQVPEIIRRRPIWRTPAYRFAVWLSDLAKADVAPLWRSSETADIADQLTRAVNGISSTLAEGYGRTTGPERARYYDYGVSSSHEASDWYLKARHHLSADVVGARLELLDRIVRILTVTIPRERADRIGRARRVRAGGRRRADDGTTPKGDG
jgi:four helix bundle protein